MAQQKIVKNVTSRPITISDIKVGGIELRPGIRTDLLTLAELSDIVQSKDLTDAINAGFIVVFDEFDTRLRTKDRRRRELEVAPNIRDSGTTSPAAPQSVTQSKGVSIEDPVETDDILFLHTPVPITISRIYGETNTGTVSFRIEWRPERHLCFGDTTAQYVHLTSLIADSNGAELTSGFNDATIPGWSGLAITVESVSGSPSCLIAIIEFSTDD